MLAISLCNGAIATRKIFDQWRANQLTEKERDLLASAAEAGIFILAASDQSGRFVMSYTREFIDSDPAITAKYLDAFLRLCDRGLVQHQGGKTFRLSGQGFDIARELAGQEGQR